MSEVIRPGVRYVRIETPPEASSEARAEPTRLQEEIKKTMGLRLNGKRSAAIRKKLDKLYPKIKLGKGLGRGKFSTAYKFTFRKPDGTEGTKVLKMTNFVVANEEKQKSGNQLNEERIGGEFMAFVPTHKNILQSEQAIVYDRKARQMIVVSAEVIQTIFENPELRKEKEWALVGTVSEFVEGSSDFCEALMYCPNFLSTEAIRNYARQMFQGIAAIHAVKFPGGDSEMTLIHRDIKLDNMLFVPPEGMSINDALAAGKGKVKILDFGFSRLIGNKDRYSRLGTPAYVAPEIVMGEPYNQKVDVYSAAVTLVALATLKLSFYKDDRDLFESISKGTDIIGNHLFCFPKVDPQLARFIKAIGHKDPAKRLTVAEALAAPFPNRVTVIPAAPSHAIPAPVVIRADPRHAVPAPVVIPADPRHAIPAPVVIPAKLTHATPELSTTSESPSGKVVEGFRMLGGGSVKGNEGCFVL